MSASIVSEEREECGKGPNISSGIELELGINEQYVEKWLLKISALTLKSLIYLLL